jgi:tRNA threonylcarbamoyladenosine biosynthesis protein TsaB
MEEPLHHAEELLPLLAELLDECGRSKDQISLVSANCGPGSFTGLRIGLATAKGLCQSLGIPLVGVDGTVAYRARLDVKGRVCVLVPNRRDLFYIRWFAGARALGEVAVLSITDVLTRISEERRQLVAIGSGAELLREQLGECGLVDIAPEEINRPSATWIARLGEDTHTKDQLYDLEPTYVEPALVKAIS